jgi:hypothetical protein
MDAARLSNLRTRYMQDGQSIRLGGLASNLGRIASVAENPGNHQAVARMLEESKFMIEWTAADPLISIEEQAVLVELQVGLARWHYRWRRGFVDQATRASLARHARAWAGRILEMAGLLNEKRG